MNIKLIFIAFLSAIVLSSCSGGYNFSAVSLEKLNTDLKEKFGADAWYTSIVLKDNGSGKKNIVTVDVTKDPNSLRQAQWVLRGEWEKSTDITLRIDGGKPEDYMFQLDKEASLNQIEKLITLSKDQLKNEESVENAEIQVASIITNNEIRTKEEGIVYTLSFFSIKENKSYSFVYDLKGNLIRFNK